MFRVIIKFFILIILSIVLFTLPKKSFAFEKYQGNPVLSPEPNTWDRNGVSSPNVIYDGTKYMMYYTGLNGSTGNIGLATSLDGMHWTKLSNNPVISSFNVESKQVGVDAPTVIRNEHGYEMWFQGIVYYPDYIDYRVYRAESSDGYSWSVDTDTVGFKPDSGWGSTGITNPTVIKNESGYKMWFSSSDTGRWALGLATSNDGKTWIPYPDNPVLVADQSWEGIDADGPSVVYDSSTYLVYYHGSGDLSYAISEDGIKWIKPSQYNPVLTRNGFDWNGMVGPSIVLLNNGTKALWYAGINSSTSPYWQIGLATDGPLPTATPTETPTPTPTPTAPPVTKVIIIPGFGGSMNAEAIQSCNAGNPDDWTSWFPSDRAYATLKKTLTQYGYNVKFFHFDWRNKPSDTAALLGKYLDNSLLKNEKVHIVAHSMGGLVARAYMEQTQNKNRIATLITAGTPHQGTILAYPAWSGGSVWGDLLWRVAAGIAIRHCKTTHANMSDRQIIQTYMPSVQTLLPVFNYLRQDPRHHTIPYDTMISRNNWLPTQFTAPFYGTKVITISGKGESTLERLDVRSPTTREVGLGNWLDGKPTDRKYSQKGDGTVLVDSSSLEGAVNIILRTDHAGLVSSGKAVKRIAEELMNSPLPGEPQDMPQLDTILVVETENAELQTDLNAEGVWQSPGVTVYFNPHKGTHGAVIKSHKPKSRVTARLYKSLNEEPTEKLSTFTQPGTFRGTIDVSSSGLMDTQ